MTTTNTTELDLDTSHLVEGGIAIFALGITIGTLVAAGMASAVVLGTVGAVATYLLSKR